MRSISLVLLSLLILTPTHAQEVSLHGISLGDSFATAADSLEARGCEVRTNATEFFYTLKCEIGERLVTVSSERNDGENLMEADVSEVVSSLSAVDVPAQEVVEKYNHFKETWSEKLGRTSPKQRKSIYYWTWETDSLEAGITYMEQNMNPHSVDVTISRP